jgi:Protein of unknown function with HXXEE motif
VCIRPRGVCVAIVPSYLQRTLILWCSQPEFPVDDNPVYRDLDSLQQKQPERNIPPHRSVITLHGFPGISALCEGRRQMTIAKTSTAFSSKYGLKAWLSDLPFRQVVWLLPIAISIHEIEELASNVDAWTRRYFIDPGFFGQIDWEVLSIGLGFVITQVWLVTVIARIPRNPRLVAFLVLPLFVILGLANALEHIFWLFYFRAYSPGIISAVCLIIPAVVFVVFKAVRERLVPWWCVAILVVPMLRNVYETVRAGNHLTQELQNEMQTGIQVTHWINAWINHARH